VTERQPSSLKRIINAGKYSRQGFIQAFHGEAAFREETYIAIILIPLACLLDVSSVERILMIGSVLLLLIVELLNSAVEAAIDRIGPEQHSLSGKAKDMGSAAVLLAVVMVFMTWGITLF
jgi:diacylglycerol kinase (ATP)